ncbi:hypothetical protein DFH11DRAFT_1546711 [Phellopilus nigrolimitatus]|nr:hypothetical protein DFH11DRAFT_1546711 [Phellopilus nigrolimitatus]
MLPFYSRSVVWPAEKKQSTFESRSKTEVVRVARVRDVGNNRPSSCRSECTHFVFSSRSCAPCTVLSSSRRPLRTATQAAETTAARVRPAAATATPEYAPPPLQQQQQQLPLPSSMLAQRRGAEHPPALSPPLPHANAAVASSTADARTLNPRPLDCWRCRLTACSSNNNNTGSRRNSNSSNSRRRRPCSLNGAALALSAATARERGRRLPICARARVLNLRPLDHRLRSHPAVSSHGRKRMRARGNLTHAGLPYVVLEFDKNGILVDGLERETKRTAKDGGDGDGVLKYSRATRPFRGRIAQRARFASARLPARPSHTLAVSPLDGLHPTRMRAVQVDPRGTGGRHTSRSSSTRTSSEKDGGAVHKPACVRESNRPTRNWRPPYVALEFDKNEIRERRRRFSYPLLCPCAPRAAAQQRATARARYLARIDRPVELRDAQSWKDRYSHYRTLYTTTRAGMHSQYKK